MTAKTQETIVVGVFELGTKVIGVTIRHGRSKISLGSSNKVILLQAIVQDRAENLRDIIGGSHSKRDLLEMTCTTDTVNVKK